MLMISTFMNTTNGKVIEAFFNIFHQGVRHAFDLANQKDVRIIAKIPLDSGWLSGKYNSKSKFFDIRNRWSKEDINIRADLVEKLKIRIPEDKNLAQVAISFCLAYDAVATVIPGNKSIDQLKRNVESIDHGITEKIIRELEYFYKEEVENLNLPW